MTPQRIIKYIIVHCSATRADRAYTAQQLERDHRARSMSGAGYHYYVERSGVVHPMRPIERAGAHTRGYNRCSIGICYEGGLDAMGEPRDTRTKAQQQALQDLLLRLRQLYPSALIVGHRDLSPDLNGDGRVSPYEWVKQCPCFDASVEYAHI